MQAEKRHHLYKIEQMWARGWAYHLIPTAQATRKHLIAQLEEDFLDRYKACFYQHNAACRDAWMETGFNADGQHFYLRNIGYTERPMWQISGRKQSGTWFDLQCADEHLKEVLAYVLEHKDLSPQTIPHGWGKE